MAVSVCHICGIKSLEYDLVVFYTVWALEGVIEHTRPLFSVGLAKVAFGISLATSPMYRHYIFPEGTSASFQSFMHSRPH